MRPLAVAAVLSFDRRRWIALITFKPVLCDVVIELLRPQHAGKPLAHDVLCVRRELLRNYGAIKLVSFAFTQREQSVETVECGLGNPGKINVGQP